MYYYDSTLIPIKNDADAVLFVTMPLAFISTVLYTYFVSISFRHSQSDPSSRILDFTIKNKKDSFFPDFWHWKQSEQCWRTACVWACESRKWIAESSKSLRSRAVREWIVWTIHGDSEKCHMNILASVFRPFLNIFDIFYAFSNLCTNGQRWSCMIIKWNRLNFLFSSMRRPTLAGRRCCLTRLEWPLSRCVRATGVHYAKFLATATKW